VTVGLPVADRWPTPADFAPPPTPRDRARWAEADHVNRPARLERLRSRFAALEIDAYFGVRPEHSRYLTGLRLDDGEAAVAGVSGQFLVGVDDLVVLADSRYTIQVRREAPEAHLEEVYGNLPARWPALLASIGARRVAVESGFVSQAVWTSLAEAAPGVELVPVVGWLEEDRAVKEPAELERIAAAAAAADRALAALLPRIAPGISESRLALDLEWEIRTGGADGLGFPIACLAGPEAALPHGSPGDRPVLDRAVLLFDFGAQVDGYRSDMTRTLFVGEPLDRDLAIYELVARAQATAIAALEAAIDSGLGMPSGRVLDAAARTVIDEAGHGDHFGHGTGHGIGLDVHEAPSLGQRAPDVALPTPTVFSVEPGIYLEGETGVRIEDLVAVDAATGTVERVTNFPRDVVVVGR
jgi:Xaa-Pro aminopeptidase